MDESLSVAQRWNERLGATSEALFVADAGGRIRYWNDGAQRLTGYRPAEVLGRRCHSVLVGRRGGRIWCEADCRVRRSLRRGALPSHVGLEVRSRDGSLLPVEFCFLIHEERGQKAIAHLLRDTSRQDQLRHALRGVLRLLDGLGEHRRAAGSASDPPPPPPAPGAEGDLSALTRRQMDVLRLLVQGQSTRAIGERLGVSAFTARNHIQNTIRKMGIHTRVQAVAAAIEQGVH